MTRAEKQLFSSSSSFLDNETKQSEVKVDGLGCFGTRRTLQYDGKKCLPTIQEDVINKSTESVSTFQSDCTVENSREEYVLFEDVRARSAKASHAAEVAISPTASENELTSSSSSLERAVPVFHPERLTNLLCCSSRVSATNKMAKKKVVSVEKDPCKR
ncbi:unnamed protein product [Brassica rapa subsp. narinosa]|uniref:Uncharacterized protein n=1 Tax=Brassica campestris TaxID=3711 RepID=M4CFZ9_BRACM